MLNKKTLTISDDLFRQAKAYAALRGQTFGNLIEQSLRKVLKEPWEVDAVVSGSGGERYLLEVKTGRYSAEDLRGADPPSILYGVTCCGWRPKSVKKS